MPRALYQQLLRFDGAMLPRPRYNGPDCLPVPAYRAATRCVIFVATIRRICIQISIGTDFRVFGGAQESFVSASLARKHSADGLIWPLCLRRSTQTNVRIKAQIQFIDSQSEWFRFDYRTVGLASTGIIKRLFDSLPFGKHSCSHVHVFAQGVSTFAGGIIMRY